MARKEFHFDFNEDAEPVEELHRLRVAMAEHFKTMEALGDYIRSTPSAKEILARWDAEEKAGKKAGKKKASSASTGRRRAKPASTPRRKRKPAARAVHA